MHNAPINLDHISPARQHTARLDAGERISLIYRDYWINYPDVNTIRGVVRAVYEMPPKVQAQCILVAAPPGMGKSSLFAKVQADLETLRKRHAEQKGYIAFSLAPDPTLGGFEECFSEALGVPIGRIRNGLVPDSFRRLVHLRKMRVVLIDEVHNLLNANRTDQRKNLAFLRALSGPPLSLSIVAFGTSEAVNAVSSDEQLERRFETYDLPRWKEDERFRSFLAGYESLLPLQRPSELWAQDKVKYLLQSTSGVTDAIVKRITRGAVWAIIEGKEKIDLSCLQKAINIPPYLDTFEE